MDVLTRMYDHHVWPTGQVLDRCDALTDADLDRVIELSVPGIDGTPTLRSLIDRTVRQFEMWKTAIEGGTQVPAGRAGLGDLRRRMAAAEPRFRTAAVEPLRARRADETFVDATCTPPQALTLGGVLAHVLTFAAARRTLAVGALEAAGVDDLGSGDPMSYVGGSGDDAASISRNMS